MHLRPWEPLFAPRDLVQGPLLVVAPHPDDEVIGAGGLVLAHRDAGARVDCVVMTDGRLGDFDGSHGEGYVELRKRECRAAGEALGGLQHEFLDFPDGGLVDALQAAETIAESAPVSRLRELIAAGDHATIAFVSPWELHPDHRATAIATLLAVSEISAERRAGLHLMAYEVGTFMPSNFLINTSDYFARKIDALRHYSSQLEHQDLARKLEGVDVARTANVDDPSVSHCEAYLRIDPARINEFLAAVESAAEVTDAMAPGVPYA